MKRKLKISLILIVLIILILIAISFYLSVKNFDNSLFNKKPEENKNSGTNSENESLNTQNNNQQATGNAIETSNNQAAQQDINSENLSCYNKQITYSIGDINEYYFCNSEEAGSCMDKTAKCSVKVKNLDETIEGNFKVKFSFFEKENRSNILETSFSNSFITPKEEKIIKSELVIQGIKANKNISCYYSTTEIPKQRICP